MMEVTSYNCRILGGVTIITAVAVVIFYHLFGNYEPSSHESEHPESLSLARPRPSPSDQCFQRLGYLSKSLPDFNVLFRNLDFNVECLSAIDGSPLVPLPNYRNPCWNSSLVSLEPYNDSFCAIPFGHPKFVDYLRRLRLRGDITSSSREKGWRMRCLPYAFIPGFTKSGTTDLFVSVSSHPHVIRGSVKEYHYWNEYRFGGGWKAGCRRRQPHQPGHMSLSEYIDRMDVKAESISRLTTTRQGQVYRPGIIVDASPSYIWRSHPGLRGSTGSHSIHNALPATLRRILPNAKFVVMMRDPTDRTVSDMQRWRKYRQASPQEIHDAISAEIKLWQECDQERGLKACVYDRYLVNKSNIIRASLYYVYLSDWLSVYPRDQFLFIKSENYFNNRSETLREVFKFLGLEEPDRNFYSAVNAMGIYNRQKSTLRIDTATKELLRQFYAPANAKLSSLLNMKVFLWRKSEI